MRNKHFTMAAVFLSLAVITASAQDRVIPRSSMMIRLNAGEAEASSYYDRQGKLISILADSTSSPYGLIREYIVTLRKYFFNISGEYSLNENISLGLDLPLSYWTQNERYPQKDTLLRGLPPPDTVRMIFIKQDRANFSLFRPDYYGISARYHFSPRQRLPMSLGIQVRIPPAFSPSDGFLVNPPFQTLLNWETRVLFSKGWIGSRIGYNIRGGSYSDEVIIHGEGGINSVPNTEIMLSLDYLESTGRFTDREIFDPRAFQLQESYFRIGGYFSLFLSDNWFVDANYSIRLQGVNSWAWTQFSVGSGLRY